MNEQRIVTWKISTKGGSKTRSGALIGQAYGKNRGVWVDWNGHRRLIPIRLVVDVSPPVKGLPSAA